MELCKAPNCAKPARWTNGYCSRHAEQVRLHGRVVNDCPSYRDPNRIEIDDQVGRIILLNKQGELVGEALIDADQLPTVAQYKWHLKANGYVQSRGKAGTFYLHRLVSGAKRGMSVDHIDGNPLNNLRANLRVCTQSQNGANRTANSNSSTGCKGVHPIKGGKKFAAQITHRGEVVSLGIFDSIEEAKAAYDEKARELFGEFAKP